MPLIKVTGWHSRRQLATILLFSVPAFLLGYSPIIMGLLVSNGLVTHPEEDIELRFRIELSDDWSAITSSESLLGRALTGGISLPSVVYQRKSWLKPWNSSRLIVSKFSIPDIESRRDNFLEVRRYAWGEILPLKPEVAGRTDFRVAVLVSHGLGIVYFDERDLYSIKSISPRVSR